MAVFPEINIATRQPDERAQKFPGAQHRVWINTPDDVPPNPSCTLNNVAAAIQEYAGGGSPVRISIADGVIYTDAADPNAIGYPQVMISTIATDLNCDE